MENKTLHKGERRYIKFGAAVTQSLGTRLGNRPGLDPAETQVLRVIEHWQPLSVPPLH